MKTIEEAQKAIQHDGACAVAEEYDPAVLDGRDAALRELIDLGLVK